MTVQGWCQSERGTMHFQQCDFNLPQIVNHFANYIDLMQIIKRSKLNACAQPYALSKGNLNVHDDENNDAEKEMNNSTENNEKEETKAINQTVMPWITLNQKGAKKLNNDNNKKKEPWHNPYDMLQYEEIDDSWSEWDEDNFETICKENEENKDNKICNKSEYHIDDIEPNLFKKIIEEVDELKKEINENEKELNILKQTHPKHTFKVIEKEGDEFIWYQVNGKYYGTKCNVDQIIQQYFSRAAAEKDNDDIEDDDYCSFRDCNVNSDDSTDSENDCDYDYDSG